MTNTRLSKLIADREAIDKRIRELSKKMSKEERALDTRRKTIIGGWVMKHRPALVRELIANGLIRGQDKAAFDGWTPEPESAKSPAPASPAPAAAPQPKAEG